VVAAGVLALLCHAAVARSVFVAVAGGCAETKRGQRKRKKKDKEGGDNVAGVGVSVFVFAVGDMAACNYSFID
jgi:hypothetical protein